jgi:iron complex transport system ATP-binding protein
MANELYTIRNVSFIYPESNWELKKISFSIHPGEVAGIIGPNGSGKSTIIKLMSGIINPTRGKILLQENFISSMPRKNFAKIVGYLPQHIQGEFDYTVYDVVSMGRYPHSKGLGFLNGSDETVVEKCLKITETIELSDRKISQLSGGERQRVFLASVLAQEPTVLLLDEPTTGLDLHHQLEFLSLLKSLSHENVAVVLATHEINLAAIYCSRLLLFNEGALICDDLPAEVITNKRMKEIFGEKIRIGKHPDGEIPFILPNTQS